MERLTEKMKDHNTDFHSEPSTRMPQRPSAVKSGEGVGFQDIGSSFGLPKPTTTYGKASKSKVKPGSKPSVPTRKVPTRITDDESDDELLLSSSQASSNASSPVKRVSKGKHRDFPTEKEETIRVNGRVLAAHPNYKPSSLGVLKGLHFKKTRKTDSPGDTPQEEPPTSSLQDSQDTTFNPISDDLEILPDRPNGPSTSRQRRSNASKQRPPSPSTKDVPPPVAIPRPRPRIIVKSKSPVRERNTSPESTPRPAARKRELPLRPKSPEVSAKDKGKQTVKKPIASSSSRREIQEFPMSFQAKENISDSACSGDGSSSKAKKSTISRSQTLVYTPKPLPLPSPLGSKTISRGNTFPNLSPLSSTKEKGKGRAASPEVDFVDLTKSREKRGGPKPFPMSSQMLASINRSPSPTTLVLKATKRASDDSGGEQGRTVKKLKDSRSDPLRVVDAMDFLNEPSMVLEDDSVDMGYTRDPSKMCPYCDEELPSHPTPFLQNLLTTARKKSRADPRPRNPRGLKAPLTIYISVCQRHRFESHQLPIASEKGWPKTIDFTKVPGRVRAMKQQLEAIIMDQDDVSDVEDTDINDTSKGPRSRSVFWRDVKKEVKKQGSRTAMGVKGQFASFEKTQPGYYGEQGSVIIHQTLFDLFPPSTFDASLITPLAPAEFIQRILVPEAAVRLIAQDLCADIEDAIVTLRESAQYGVAMFPDTSESKHKGAGVDDDEMGVADQIVMERARIRRKELAEEERVEEEMLEEERAAQRAKAREMRREKALERAKLARQAKGAMEKPEDRSELSEASTTRRTRQTTRQRATTDNSESDAMSVDSSTSRRSTRAKKVAQEKPRVKARPESDASDSDSVEVVGDSRNKAPVRRGKTRERSVDPVADGNVGIGSRERKKAFGGFASLINDEDHESTPRPSRQRTAIPQVDLTSEAGPASGTTAGTGSEARLLPLQIARNRSAASTANSNDGWSRSLRSNVPDDGDSDTSNTSRRSQRLVRPPQRSGGSYAWLFSQSSTSD